MRDTALAGLGLAVLLAACGPREPEVSVEAPSVETLLDPERIEALEALGYSAGTNEPRSDVVVTVHDAARIQPGFNLYTSGHEPEANLIDVEGRVLHRWRFAFDAAFPGYDRFAENPGNPFRWRRVHLFPNGDLVAIYEGLGIIRLDRDSRLVWASDVSAHHDLAVAENGDLWVLTRSQQLLPRVNPDEPILEDAISLLGPDGREKRRFSVLEAFERSAFADMQRASEKNWGDILHTNTIAVLDGRLADRHPAFAAGNLLISVLYLDALAIVDPEREEVVWARQGIWKSQHEPQLLENGRLLLFDNRGAGDVSRVLELDPFGDEVYWEYRGTVDRPFYTKWCGSSARLANGNTLITESDDGRAFEVTPAGEIVWEFYNPHRVGESYEKIATLFELIRLPDDFPIGWAVPPAG